MKKLTTWIKKASRSNRVFRTFVQGFSGYLIAQFPVFWDGSGDLRLALEALLVGALAAGISAVWKTPEAEFQASKESGRHD